VKHTISVLVENKFGVLARIAGLFSARGFNIESLAVGETEDPTVSRMTIVAEAEDERVLDQIIKQLHKLIDVITVIDLTQKEYINKELAFFKLPKKANIKDVFKGLPCEVIKTTDNHIIVQVVGDRSQIHEVIERFKEIGITELVRTGVIAVAV